VLGCPGCGGLWVPNETLEPLIEGGAQYTAPQAGGDQPRPVTGGVQYLKCPTCSTLMSRRNYGRVSGVILDSCPAHGVWLDSGELQALRTFVASGGRQRQAKADADKQRLAEQLVELRRQAAEVRPRGGYGDF
jgi:Zn-finger nucleic acid-binding protein